MKKILLLIILLTGCNHTTVQQPSVVKKVQPPMWPPHEHVVWPSEDGPYILLTDPDPWNHRQLPADPTTRLRLVHIE